MKVPALLFIAIGLVGCGNGETPPPQPARSRPSEAELTCPVEGTRFVPSRGVVADLGTSGLQVCSRGCAIRAEASPERYLQKAK